MKFRNPLSPNTKNTSPIRIRTMVGRWRENDFGWVSWCVLSVAMLSSIQVFTRYSFNCSNVPLHPIRISSWSPVRSQGFDSVFSIQVSSKNAPLEITRFSFIFSHLLTRTANEATGLVPWNGSEPFQVNLHRSGTYGILVCLKQASERAFPLEWQPIFQLFFFLRIRLGGGLLGELVVCDGRVFG